MIILVGLLFFQVPIFGQIYHGPLQVSLSLHSDRVVLYAGIENVFTLNSNLPLNRWDIKSTNGSAIMSSIGLIAIKPQYPGKDSISLYYITENNEKKLVQRNILNVEPLPAPQIAAGKNNRISLSELKDLKTLNVIIPNLQFYIPFLIKECKIMTIKIEGEKTTFTQNGKQISDAIKKHLETLKKGDIIIIKDVKVNRENSRIIEEAIGIFLTIM
jgi:hypothetical protein